MKLKLAFLFTLTFFLHSCSDIQDTRFARDGWTVGTPEVMLPNQLIK